MSIYAGVATATLQSWLTEAQTAFHELVVLKRTVNVAIGDKRVAFAFSASGVADLKAHIRGLQTAIAIAQGSSTGSPYSVATWNRVSGGGEW